MIDKEKILTLLRSPKTKKNAIRFLVTFLIIGVLGGLVLPPFVKSTLLDQLGKALHRPVSVKSVSINPYALSVTLEGVSVLEPDGNAPFVTFDSLYLNLESSSLFRGGLVLGEIRLLNPKLKIVRLQEQRYNFSDLLDEVMAKPKSEGPSTPFSLNNIQISGGVVEFDDRPVDEKHVVSDLNLTLPFVSSMAYAIQSFVEPAFSAHINGAPMVIKGKSKPFDDSLESEVLFDLANLELAKFIDYSPIKLPVKMLSGALDSNLKLVFRQEKKKPATLALSGTVGIKNVRVKDNSGLPLLSFKQLDLVMASADLLGARFEIERFALDSPEIHARVSRQGDINWLEFFSREMAVVKPKGPGDKDQVVVSASTPPSPLYWALAHAKISDGALRWTDESHGKPFDASIERIELDVRNLTSKAGQPGEFDVSWRVAAGEWLKIDSFSIKGGQLDLAKRELVLDDVQAKGARSLIRRLQDGKIDWLKPPALRVVQATQKDAAHPWAVTVAKYSGDDIGLRFEDSSVKPVAIQTIEGLGFVLENVSTLPGQTVKVSTRFKFNRKGEVEVKGTVNPLPLKTDLALDIKSIELLPLQAYFAEKLNIAVTRGQLTVNGNVQLRQEASNKPGLTPSLAGGFTGQATIGDFFAVDKLNSAEFLRWKSFYFGKVEASLGPDALSIGEIALSDFFARVIISPEGKLNLMQIVRKDESIPTELVPSETAVAPADGVSTNGGKAVAQVEVESKPMMPIKIGKITLQGGNIRFSDNFVKPNYTANLRQIGGRVTGLSSEPGSVASLELRGSYDNIAPLNITARINPLSAKPYLDLQADIKGVEMTSFSSYSGKYAGYAIEKGKLSLFVKYKIENNLLEAENRVFVDQLTFGDPVESATATKLPVNLAVSLLKNRNGEIDLNLPISGSLNDPQFSIGGLVVKVIVNLFVKAVTSPFALLGSMFGGGEEMSNVEFEFGRARITAAAQKRLENLSKAMIDRPAIKLELDGRVDQERDREGLKSARIDRLVRSLKREDLTKKGIESGSADSIEITDQEYPVLLERVYRAEKFPKPRNMVGFVKTLPVDEMEKLILANSSIADDDLRELADNRAKVVRDWLVEHEISADRVFLLPSKLGESVGKSDADTKASLSRVDFSLK